MNSTIPVYVAPAFGEFIVLAEPSDDHPHFLDLRGHKTITDDLLNAELAKAWTGGVSKAAPESEVPGVPDTFPTAIVLDAGTTIEKARIEV